MSSLVFDFADDWDVEKKVRDAVSGLTSKSAVVAILSDAVIRPEPGRLYGIEGTPYGFKAMFVIGEGERPRVVDCQASDFNVFA